MEYRFTCSHPVRWKDIDSEGVLNNAVYLTLVEHSRYEYFRSLDLLEEGRISFVLGEARVRFHRPGRLGMDLTLAARVTRLGGKSFEMTYEVRHGESLLATASAILVYVDRSFRTREIPELVRRRISEFEGIPRRHPPLESP